MTPLRSRDLNRRIVVFAKSEVDNGAGGWTEIYTKIAQPWAEVKGLDGRESVMNQVLQGISVYRIRVRYRDDVTDTCQIYHDGRVLNIRSAVDPDGAREQLLIMADTASTEPVPNGG